MPRIAHAVKIVAAPPGSEWAIAQPVTFASMRAARDFAGSAAQVEFHAAFAPREEPYLPEGFRKLRPLERDVTALKPFKVPRPLPILKDVLDRLHEGTDAEYLIYTNVDIALMPPFYAEVARLIAEGHDAIVINRRTIPALPNRVEDLPAMYATIGKPHPGYDCFVFRRDLYPHFILGDVCLGTGHVDLPLICSMIAFAKKFALLEHEHLTFHLGDPRTWRRPELRDYQVHNDKEAAKAVLTLAKTAPRAILPQYRLLASIPLLKNAWFVEEFRRMFSR